MAIPGYGALKDEVAKIMADMEVVSKAHEASGRGDTVNLQELHEIIERMDNQFATIEKNSIMARMGGIGQIRRQMKKWMQDIERKQAEKGNVFVPFPERKQETPDEALAGIQPYENHA